MTAMMLTVALLAATVADVQSALDNRLAGGPSTAADAQRDLSELLEWRAETPSGVVVAGHGVSAADLDPRAIEQEVANDAPVQCAFTVSVRTPCPIRVFVPWPRAIRRPEAYQRVSTGLYIRLASPLHHLGDYLSFESETPGSFVVRETDSHSYPPEPHPFFDFTPPSDAPDAKADWALVRVEPDRIAGPIPIVLLHGSDTDRWADFVHWAANSPEALSFRGQFQLWDFYQPVYGVNAAIGFGPDYPAFNESIVAYLNRFLLEAMDQGVPTGGIPGLFPEGPFAMLAHSQGGLKARAFLVNFPEQADRVFAVVTVSAPHMGTPWATPEWLRHTVSRLGFSEPRDLEAILETAFSDLFLYGYVSVHRQSDMDMGWENLDEAAGLGLPTVDFSVAGLGGLEPRTLSPRDANLTGARQRPGLSDATFEPAAFLATYCGGLDQITPAARGDLYLDRFFLYGSYLTGDEDWHERLASARDALQQPRARVMQNAGLRVANLLMGLVLSKGADAPTGLYRLNDGFVPLQSQLMLDGLEPELLYKTRILAGARVPVVPLTVKDNLIKNHTLADPDRIRLLPGYTHLDTITGRYNPATGHSELFSMIAEDILQAARSIANHPGL